MNKKICLEYCKMKIWRPCLCSWCTESNCKERRELPRSPLKNITNRNSRFYKIKEAL